MPAPLIDQIDAELRALGAPERAMREKAYLKSALTHYGVPVPATRKLATSVLAANALSHDDLVALATALWSSPVHERRAITVELLTACGSWLDAGDLEMIERFLREARTWALVDHLAEKVAGALVVREEAARVRLDDWAADGDFWIRRSALLALLGPLRAGGGDFDRFGRYADAMLNDSEFFIRKAIGWVLRDTAKKRPGLVFHWLLPRAGRASGITVREAIKPLHPAQRDRILAARDR